MTGDVADGEVDESPPQLARSRWRSESPETPREWKFSFWSICPQTVAFALRGEHRELVRGFTMGDRKRSSVSSGFCSLSAVTRFKVTFVEMGMATVMVMMIGMMVMLTMEMFMDVDDGEWGA